MKTTVCLIALVVASKLAMANPTYDAAINETRANPSAENIIELGGHLRGVARYNKPPESSPYYSRIQQTLLSIPGHARYFADEIKREQKEVATYPTITGPRNSYDRHRTWHFEALSHLPSPETIAILGDFLSDDIDTPVPLLSPDSDWGENPRANSFGSSATILNIGLRNPPVAIERRNDDPEARLAKTRAWWEDIKTGRKTFSFKGQAVEYRFKPDGTWETMPIANPPDDAPSKSETPAVEKPVSRPPPAKAVENPKPVGNSWAWIIGGLITALAGLIWYGARKLKGNG